MTPRPPLPGLVDLVLGRFVAGILTLAPFVLTHMLGCRGTLGPRTELIRRWTAS